MLPHWVDSTDHFNSSENMPWQSHHGRLGVKKQLSIFEKKIYKKINQFRKAFASKNHCLKQSIRVSSFYRQCQLFEKTIIRLWEICSPRHCIYILKPKMEVQKQGAYLRRLWSADCWLFPCRKHAPFYPHSQWLAFLWISKQQNHHHHEQGKGVIANL